MKNPFQIPHAFIVMQNVKVYATFSELKAEHNYLLGYAEVNGGFLPATTYYPLKRAWQRARLKWMADHA
jgi:hypothetical protein